MKKFFIICGLIVILISCGKIENSPLLSADYLKTLKENQEERAQNRIGYLELAGLFKLDSTSNTFGKNHSNKFILDINYLPSKLGTIVLTKQGLSFKSEGNSYITDESGYEVISINLDIDANGNSIKLYHKFLKWQVITRSGDLYLRVWDTKNPAIKAFKGFKNYEANAAFVLKGYFKYFKAKHTESVSSKLGINDFTDFIGKVEFNFKEKSYTLDVGSQGFTMVGDLTSGESSYGVGRYLYLELPETDGEIRLDFNYLFNPPCAFSAFTTCLFPPSQNQLPIKIEAGERIEKVL